MVNFQYLKLVPPGDKIINHFVIFHIPGCLRLKESPDTLKGYEDASIKEPQHFKKTLTSQESKTASALVAAEDKNRDEYTLPHPIWSDKEVDSVEIHHRKPVSLSDKLAYRTVMFMRTTFDLASGYTIGKSLQTLDERSVLTRCIFLETVAGTHTKLPSFFLYVMS